MFNRDDDAFRAFGCDPHFPWRLVGKAENMLCHDGLIQGRLDGTCSADRLSDQFSVYFVNHEQVEILNVFEVNRIMFN